MFATLSMLLRPCPATPTAATLSLSLASAATASRRSRRTNRLAPRAKEPRNERTPRHGVIVHSVGVTGGALFARAHEASSPRKRPGKRAADPPKEAETAPAEATPGSREASEPRAKRRPDGRSGEPGPGLIGGGPGATTPRRTRPRPSWPPTRSPSTTSRRIAGGLEAEHHLAPGGGADQSQRPSARRTGDAHPASLPPFLVADRLDVRAASHALEGVEAGVRASLPGARNPCSRPPRGSTGRTSRRRRAPVPRARSRRRSRDTNP